MLLTEILNNYQPAYPEPYNWETTFAYLRSQETDWNTVQQLVEELQSNGQFRNPIVLSTPEEDTDDETGEYEPYVQNGTHRIFAHHLTGIQEVKVQHGWGATDSALYPYSYTTVAFEKALTEEQFDVLINKFRSHKISNELWIECDVIAGKGDEATLYWAKENHDPNIFTKATHNILTNTFPEHAFNTTTTTIHDEEEEKRILGE